ncbi:aa3-type cytochrome c oxidase subunit IV [Sphingobium estronivorans]|nr:aa3-type cytochrome c oxidase subunit IV [Sphingobium estronivorans]
MATEGNIENATHTYEGFVALMKWGTIACAVVGALVVVLIAH